MYLQSEMKRGTTVFQTHLLHISNLMSIKNNKSFTYLPCGMDAPVQTVD